MIRPLIVAAAVLIAAQVAAVSPAEAAHPIMTRLGHGLSHGLHRLGRGLHNLGHGFHGHHHHHWR
jgi:hypothetical protein